VFSALGCAEGTGAWLRPWLGVLTGITGEGSEGDGPGPIVVLTVNPLPPAGTTSSILTSQKAF